MQSTLVRLAITHSELFAGWPDDPVAQLIDAADLATIEPGQCVHRSGTKPVSFTCSYPAPCT